MGSRRAVQQRPESFQASKENTVKFTVINRFLGLGLLASGLFVGVQPVEAQLVIVDAKYRIVEVDRSENRIGVALPDATGNERQNWVYIKPDTRASRRQSTGNGTFRDEAMTPQGVMNAAEVRIGQMMKINGGRDFDGSVNAKKVWM
jgi:hypothetical protein